MKKKIKEWVVKTALVTKPYNKDWSASVTLHCYDYNEYGESIEQAYNKLTDKIYLSKYLLGSFIRRIWLNKYKP